LFGIALVGRGANRNLAVKHASSVARKDSVVNLMTSATLHHVENRGVAIHQSLPVGDTQPVQRALCILAAKRGDHFVAHKRAAHVDAVPGAVRTSRSNYV